MNAPQRGDRVLVGSLALLRFEWTKMAGRRIFWVPFLVLAVVVGLIVAVFHHIQFKHMLALFQALHQNLSHKSDFVNAYYMAAHAMNPVFQLLIPIFITVAAGLMVAGEAEDGTLRACLVRPVSRGRLLLTKFGLLAAYALALSFFYLGLLLTAGVLNFGTGNLYTLNIIFHNGDEGVSTVLEAEAPLRFFYAGMVATLGTMVLASLALLVSALVETAAMAYVVTLSIYFAAMTLRFLTGLDWLYPYLFVTHMLRWQQCFYSYPKWGDIYVSMVHLAAYVIVFLCAAIFLFEERDIKS
jgi:ABC-type transport system involved in multi-copper enzyme maturation permease subunit